MNRSQELSSIRKPSSWGDEWIHPNEESTQNPKLVKNLYKDVETALNKWGINKSIIRLLEIGSGRGVMMNEFLSNDINAIGVEARIRSFREGLPIQEARVEDMPFQDESFDVIFSTNVFDNRFYRQDQEQMQSEISRVLKPGGFYINYEKYIDEFDIPGVEPISWIPLRTLWKKDGGKHYPSSGMGNYM